MTYVELDLDDDLYGELETLAEEEGVTVEELILDILKDEFAIVKDELEDEDLLDEEDELSIIPDDDDIN